MFNMLFAVVFLLVLSVVKSKDICIWGRIGTMEIMNGEWTYMGYFNNAPYYKLYIDASFTPNVQYLWRYHTQYQMTDYSPKTYGYGYTAKCMISTTNPIDCGPNWRVGAETSNDINIFIQTAPCPTWTCDAIEIGIEPECYGLFDRKIAPNAWSNSNDIIFYFHPSEFRWLCGSKYDLTYNSAGYAWTEPNWTKMSKDNSVSLYFEYPTNDKGWYTINCISNTVSSTLSPTNKPTSVQLISSTTQPTFAKTTQIKYVYTTQNSMADISGVNGNDFGIKTIVVISGCVLFLISGIGICGYLYGKRKHKNNNDKNASDNAQFTIVNSNESIEKHVQEVNSVNDTKINVKALGFTRGNSNFVIPGLTPAKTNSDGYQRVMQELEGILDNRKNLNRYLSKGSDGMYEKGNEISEEITNNGLKTVGETVESMASLIGIEGVTKHMGDI
eukprot:14788_1